MNVSSKRSRPALRSALRHTRVALGLGLWSALALSASPELLAPDQAFKVSAQVLDASRIELRYRIASGYYLYKDKLGFELQPQEVRIGTPLMPRGQVKQDPFFGEVEIFRDSLIIVLPVSRPGRTPQHIALKVGFQGCAEQAGVCYLPQRKSIFLQLPGTP